jgi:hypothetical protein
MTYQWFKDGGPIAGATSSSYTILSLLGSDSGVFSVKVTNAGGSVMSANAYLNIAPPPTVTTQPQSQVVSQGQSVSFSVAASGSGSISYQWYFNGVSLGGAANSSTYSINSVIMGNAGNYTVVVANSTGSATSAVATLTVSLPLTITTQPQSQAVTQGQSVSFSVMASGSVPSSYQWYFNGLALSGANAPVLTLTNVQTSQSGDYTVVVANTVASTTSAVASLAVTPAKITLSLGDSGGMASNGFTFQSSVPAGRTYVVFASTDLLAWTPIATNVAATASVAFTDVGAANQPHRFYRTVVQ